MIKLTDFETPKAAARRRKKESIIRDYLSCASYIRVGKVTPHAVFSLLAREYTMSRYGVQKLLTREGIYKDPVTPVIVPERFRVQPKQLSMPFFEAHGQSPSAAL